MASLQSFELRTINNLPAELVLQNQILKRLSLTDLLNAKLVCKLWNWLISGIRIERLFVDADLDVTERWFHSKRRCRESELCLPDQFVEQCKKPILSNLKYLKMNNRILWPSKLWAFHLNRLNAFRQLVQLEIDYNLTGNLHLCLPNLVVLSLGWNNNKCEIKLDLPKLKVLRYDGREDNDRFRVEHPETVRVLESRLFGAKLAQFKGVECLRWTISENDILNESTLRNLKKLKELHYDLTIGSYEYHGYEEVMQALREFMRRKRELGRSDLKVYFCGLLLIAEDLSDIDFGLKVKNGKYLVSPERLYMTHYDRLKTDMELVWQVDYNLLLSLVQVLPEDYFDRFNGIREVFAHCPVDEQHFLDFLKKNPLLKWLVLYDSNLSQAFFDCLPEFCSLGQFYLFGKIRDRFNEEHSDEEDSEEKDNKASKADEENEEEEIELDFSFLGKFARLIDIGISKSLSLKSIRSFVSAITNQKALLEQRVKFKFRGNEYELWMNIPDYDEDWKVIINDQYEKLNLECGEKWLLKDVNVHEVVEYFEHAEHSTCSESSSNVKEIDF